MRKTITIKKRPQMWPLLWMLIFFPFCLGTLNDFLGLPYAVRYVLDIVWVALLVLTYYVDFYSRAGMKGIIIWVLVFFGMTLAVFPVQYQSPLYYAWGVRNNFRFYAAFFAFACFLKMEEIEDSLKWFDVLFWINIVVSVVQFFLFELRQDNLGGLFGSQSGVNGSTNIFFLIVLTKSVVFYLEKKESVWLLILKTAAALLVAAIAEMKFLFVEFALVIVLAVLFTDFTWRKLFVILGGCAAIVGFAALLTFAFPQWGNWLALEWFVETATSDLGYTGNGDLNRLNAIPQINELWLKHWPQRLFGKGMGNCDTSSVAALNTPFFRQYGDMHYNWISYAIMYLETGYFGLVFFFGFFVMVYLGIRRIGKESTGAVRAYCCIGRIMAIMCVILAVYNSSLRGESGYMAYFMLAIPFALAKHNPERQY